MKNLLFLLSVLFVTVSFGQKGDKDRKKGDAKLVFKDYRGAIVDYNKAIEIDPTYLDAYVSRGIAKDD